MSAEQTFDQTISGNEPTPAEGESGRFLDLTDPIDDMRRRAVADLQSFLDGALARDDAPSPGFAVARGLRSE